MHRLLPDLRLTPTSTRYEDESLPQGPGLQTSRFSRLINSETDEPAQEVRGLRLLTDHRPGPWARHETPLHYHTSSSALACAP